MTTFVIFWAALFTIFFFITGTCFKALASAFNALLNSAGVILVIAGLALAAVVALSLIYGVIDAIGTGNIGQVILTIILLVVILGFFGAIFGGLGAVLFGIAVTIVTYVLTAVSVFLEKAALICERGYAKSLTAIASRVEKC